MLSPSLHSPPNPWLLRLVTFLLAAFVAASVGYWALKWPAPARTSVVDMPTPETPPIDSAKVAQLLGADTGLANGQTAAVNEASRFKLVGVIALGSRNGSALITVDGQPAKPFRVGEHLTDELILQAVDSRSVTLAADRNSKEGMALELPPVPGAQ